MVTVSEERLLVSTQWVETGRVRVRRRVTSETRSVQVTVRREELLIETDAEPGADDTNAANTGVANTNADNTVVGEPHLNHEPLVIVLREDVPEVTVTTRPYERVIVHVDLAATEETVGGQVRREHADVTVESDAGEAGNRPAPSEF